MGFQSNQTFNTDLRKILHAWHIATIIGIYGLMITLVLDFLSYQLLEPFQMQLVDHSHLKYTTWFDEHVIGTDWIYFGTLGFIKDFSIALFFLIPFIASRPIRSNLDHRFFKLVFLWTIMGLITIAVFILQGFILYAWIRGGLLWLDHIYHVETIDHELLLAKIVLAEKVVNIGMILPILLLFVWNSKLDKKMKSLPPKIFLIPNILILLAQTSLTIYKIIYPSIFLLLGSVCSYLIGFGIFSKKLKRVIHELP